jgi:Family of unknown function (DUF6412)
VPLKGLSLLPVWAAWLPCLALGLHAAGPGVTATAAVTFAFFAALALALSSRVDAAVGADPRPMRTAVKARARRTVFLPQRDPDASGKPRPRAPGHCRTPS